MANLGWIVRGRGRKDILRTLKSQDGRIGLHLGLPALVVVNSDSYGWGVADVGVHDGDGVVGMLTSLVFHRWRWVGKWSDFGNDSRDSGSLIGSPSGEETV